MGESEMAIEPICEILEAHMKTRTFLVGQRLSLADISLACSVKQSFEKKGLDELRKKHPNTIRWLQTCVHQFMNDVPTAASASTAPAPKKTAAPATAAPAKVSPPVEAPPAKTKADTQSKAESKGEKDAQAKA